MKLKLVAEGSVGNLLTDMALECSTSDPPVRPGLSIVLHDSTDVDRANRNWILLDTEQAKKLADYLRKLYP